MSTSAFTAPDAPSRLTYARARLLLGISGVGTAVLVAAALLAFELPARLLSASVTQPLRGAVASLAISLALGALLFLPFDVVGGAILVRRRPAPAHFLARWGRGVAVQLAVALVAASLMIAAARAAGNTAALLVILGLQLLLAALRAPLARVIAPLRPSAVPERLRRLAARAGIAPDRIALVDVADEGFVGGWSGISGRTLLLPVRWLALPDEALVAVLVRRRLIAESGAHRRGVLGATVWNTLGAAVVLLLTDAVVGSAAGVLELASGMTLWAFLGVLLLPTPSRAAVLAADAAAAHEGEVASLRDAIDRLDRWQDDEERRPAGVETIFHPVPSRSVRHARLRQMAPASPPTTPSRLDRQEVPGRRQVHHLARHAHHLARHALWLGWGTLSPLSRLVHCNAGRPALWAMLPGD